MCAPTSKIDDQALAVMGGDGAAQAGSPDASPTSSTAHSAHALKVVLPARADRFGRWRGQSVVYVEPEPGADAGGGRRRRAAPARLSYAELAAGAPALPRSTRP
jgi:conjugal transfer pilus assembly protein TraV